MRRFLSDPDLRKAASGHRRRLVAATIAVTGRSGLALAGPFLLGKGVDLVARQAPTSEVLELVMLMAAFALSTAVCQFAMRRLWITWSRVGEMRVRGGLFQHLINLPVSFHQHSQTGDLMSRLTSDVEAVRMGYGPGLMHTYQTGVLAVGSLSLMIACSPWLALWAAIPMVIMFLVLARLMHRIHEHSMAVQVQQGALSARAQESFSGTRVIKAFSRETHEEQRFSDLSIEYRQRSVALAGTRAWFRCFVEQFAGLAIIIVLLVGGYQVITGAISIGDYAAFNGYLQMLIWPAIALGWTLALFQRAEAAEERLQVLRHEDREPTAGDGVDPSPVSGKLTFRNLTYTYEGASETTLDDISIEVPAGSTLGIVGRTGSGKSSLAHLLLRLHEPPPGTILLDDRCVRELDLHALRSAIAIVPQETFLFSDTIGKNVAFGARGATPAAIAEAAALACLDEAVEDFPDGFETRVGERGVTLSGGQRQRTSIARALLVNAPILILDDAFSAVDTETEQKILERILPVMRGRTTILISHRVSTVRHADHILVLAEGRITEQGSHQDLLALGGTYAEIHRLQKVAEELENL